MSRKLTREIIMNTLYQMDIHGEFLLASFEKYLFENLEAESDLTFAKTTLEAFLNHKEEVDTRISENLVNWTIDRISKVDLAILRLASTEIFYIEDITTAIAINEAVNLAKKYGDESSGQFVNGVLGEIVRIHEVK